MSLIRVNSDSYYKDSYYKKEFNAAQKEPSSARNGDRDAAFYNALPFADEAAERAADLHDILNNLACIISKYGLDETFAVCLVHRRFDLELHAGERFLFRTIVVLNVCDAIVMGPVSSSSGSPVYGKSFAVNNSGRLVPYEFTTGAQAGADIDAYPAFAKEVTASLISTDRKSIFGLIRKPCEYEEAYFRFEYPEERSMVMIPDKLISSDANEIALRKDWFLLPGGRLDGNN